MSFYLDQDYLKDNEQAACPMFCQMTSGIDLKQSKAERTQETVVLLLSDEIHL